MYGQVLSRSTPYQALWAEILGKVDLSLDQRALLQCMTKRFTAIFGSSLSIRIERALDRVRRGWALARAWGANPGRRHLMAKPTIAFVGLSGGETVEGQSPVATIVNTWLTPTLTG